MYVLFNVIFSFHSVRLLAALGYCRCLGSITIENQLLFICVRLFSSTESQPITHLHSHTCNPKANFHRTLGNHIYEGNYTSRFIQLLLILFNCLYRILGFKEVCLLRNRMSWTCKYYQNYADPDSDLRNFLSWTMQVSNYCLLLNRHSCYLLYLYCLTDLKYIPT